jgi:hypothetical protein
MLLRKRISGVANISKLTCSQWIMTDKDHNSCKSSEEKRTEEKKMHIEYTNGQNLKIKSKYTIRKLFANHSLSFSKEKK